LAIGAKDVMATLTVTELEKINGLERINCFGLTRYREQEGLRECSVLMLSREMPNSSSISAMLLWCAVRSKWMAFPMWTTMETGFLP